MYRTLVLFLATLLASTVLDAPAHADDAPKGPATEVILAEENHVALRDGAVAPFAFIYAASRFTSHVGAFGYVGVSKGYALAYAGPMYFHGPLSFGIGAGAEQWDKPWRVALFSTLTLEKFRTILMAEYGGSGPWVRAIAAGVPDPHLGLGAFAELGRGIGPYVDVFPAPTKFPFSVYAALPFGPLNPRGSLIAGARLYL